MSQVTLHPSSKGLAYFEYKQSQYLIQFDGLGINNKIMNKIFKQLDVMVSYYSKVTMVQLQFHLHEPTPDNRVISRFLNSLTNKLKKQYKSQIGYVWVREKNGAPAQHYHMAVMLSGHVCKSSHHIYNIANETWSKQNENGYSFRVKNSLYKISRYCDKELDAARFRLSYFAKNKTKDFDTPVQKFGVSRLPFNSGET